MFFVHLVQAIILLMFTKHCVDIVFDEKKINVYERGWFVICMFVGSGLAVYNFISIGIILSRI